MGFIDRDLGFIYPLIEGYQELWSEKRELPWSAAWPCLLDFCLELVERDDFWIEENCRERSHFIANRHSIVGAIARLLDGGTKSDDNAFDKNFLPQEKQILLILINHPTGYKFKTDSDAVYVAINSSSGRDIERPINISLTVFRLAA